jgi:hypothetical protein
MGLPRGRLTMRLSDAGLRQPETKAVYPNHRSPPSPNEDATRDRSNRLLGLMRCVLPLEFQYFVVVNVE